MSNGEHQAYDRRVDIGLSERMPKEEGDDEPFCLDMRDLGNRRGGAA